jgi:hypothetical protein
MGPSYRQSVTVANEPAVTFHTKSPSSIPAVIYWKFG